MTSCRRAGETARCSRYRATFSAGAGARTCGVEAAAGSSLSGRAVTMRRRNGNPASSFRASITAARAPVASRSSASITTRTSDWGAKRWSGPTTCLSRLPSRCCSAYGVSFTKACCASRNRGSERASCSARMRASSCDVVASVRNATACTNPAGTLPPATAGHASAAASADLPAPGLPHHRHATLSPRTRHHLSEVRRYLIRQCKSLDLVGQRGVSPRLDGRGRRSSPTTAPHPGCRPDAAAPGSGKTALAESADAKQRKCSAGTAEIPSRSNLASVRLKQPSAAGRSAAAVSTSKRSVPFRPLTHACAALKPAIPRNRHRPAPPSRPPGQARSCASP